MRCFGNTKKRTTFPLSGKAVLLSLYSLIGNRNYIIPPIPPIPGAPIGISGLSSIENAPLTGALSGTQETELRKLSGALVTAYDYLPYVGVVSITDAAGIKVQYEYDSYGRLKNVMDGEGCLKENYEYHVQQ